MRKCATYHIGETRIMKCGMKATVINYYPSHKNIKSNKTTPSKVDIQFEDGCTLTDILYFKFRDNKTNHPDMTYAAKLAKTRLGETRKMNNGMSATIINYRKSTDIDIQFEDGVIVTNKLYDSFIRGGIGYPNNRLNETRKMSNGMSATIIKYRNSMNIDVQFEDGSIVTNTRYDMFVKQSIGDKVTYLAKVRIGETRQMTNGMSAKIIAYRKHNDIDIQFEDGTVATNKVYSAFLQHNVKYPSNRLDEVRKMTNGVLAKIITYHKSNDIDIQFEDGAIVTNRTYKFFVKGRIAHPTIAIKKQGYKGTLFGVQITGIAYQLQQSPIAKFPTTYFNYVHPETKEHCIGTVSEIHQLALDYKLISKPQLLTFD